MLRSIGFISTLLISFALAQSSVTLDDTDRLLAYAGSWTHDSNGPSYLYSGSQSWTNDPTATVSFAEPMTGFDLCAGKKADRGTFSITIDGVASGSGSQQGVNTQEGACEVVASVRNLSGGSHSVVLANSGSTYFAVDSITVYNDQATTSEPAVAAATQATTSSISTRGRAATTSSFSMSILAASTSSSAAAVSSSSGTTESQEAESQPQHKNNRAAIIGGSLAGGLVLALLIAVAAWQIVKRQKADKRDSFTSGGYDNGPRIIDEKNFWSEKQPMSQAAGPAGGYSPSNSSNGITSGAALPRSTGFSNLHRRTGSKQDSLNSHTSEPYNPEILEHQPPIEPYYPARFTPTPDSRRQSGASHRTTTSVSGVAGHPVIQNVFNSPPRSNTTNISHPYDVAPIKTKNSYETRLAAASANLPDFTPPYSANAPIPRRQPTHLYPIHQQPRAISTASSAYPPSEARSSVAPRLLQLQEDPYADSHSINSNAYSGIEEEEDAVEEERRRRATRMSENPFETYSLYERAHNSLETRKSKSGTLGPAWHP